MLLLVYNLADYYSLVLLSDLLLQIRIRLLIYDSIRIRNKGMGLIYTQI